MKAEDKAKELVEHFAEILPPIITGQLVNRDWETAKQCATITVDEILSNVSLSDKAYDLWQQVKSHINQ